MHGTKIALFGSAVDFISDKKETIMKNADKRKLILVLTLAVSLMLTLAACGGEGGPVEFDPEKTYTLRMATMASQGTPLYNSCVWFVDRVSELTDGNVQITLFPSSQLGDYTAVMGEIILGSIDISWQSIATEYDARFAVEGIPYFASNWDEVQYAYSKGSWICNLYGTIAGDLGMVHVGGSPSLFLSVAGKNLGNLNDIFNPDVKKDVLLRIAPFPVNEWIFDYLNYNVTVIPYADLYSALQTGLADCWYGGGVELNYDDFRDIIKYYAAFDIAQAYSPLFISGKTMNNLPVEYQDALMQAGWEATDQAFKFHMDSEDEYYKKLEAYGIEIIKPTKKQMDVIAAGMREEVWPRLASLIGDELLDGLYEFAEQMKADLEK